MINMKEKQFVINSMDGVDLFTEDDFWWVRKKEKGNKKWYLEHHEGIDIYRFTFNVETYQKALVFESPEFNKAFSTKKEAEKFIKYMNH